MTIKARGQITLMDLTDGFAVFLTSDSCVFPGADTHALAGSRETQVLAYQGTKQVAASVNQSAITKPSGVTVAVDNKNTSPTAPTISITVAATVTSGGEVDIPVVIGTGEDAVTIHKIFSFSIALTGVSITGISSKYALNNSATTAPTTWVDTPAAPTSSSKYLWSYEIITYSSGNPTETEPHVIGTFGSTGSTGTAGSVWYTGTGVTGTSTTATVFSGSGVSSAKVNDMYLNTSTGYTYKCTVAGAASAAKWVYAGSIKGSKGDTGNTGAPGATGAPGEDGADAILIAVTATDGNILRNSEGSTTLVATVLKGGVKLSTAQIATLGTLKWYKDYVDGGTNTAIGIGETKTIAAADFDKLSAYDALLEG